MKEAVTAGRSAAPGRSVTSRALAILDAFCPGSPRLPLSEIAERSRTPLTTAHRLLGELADWGALVRRQAGRYEIGRKLWDLGLRDTVHLAVRDGLSAL